jgi:hypothetical protein
MSSIINNKRIISQENSEVKNYQKKLDKDEEVKRHYVEAELSESDSDLSSDEEESPAITISQVKRKKDLKDPISSKLFQRVLELQETNMKAQKAIFKLRNELNTEEIQARYVKLDLNNAQVKIGELETKGQLTERELYMARTENYATRSLFVIYMLWVILSALRLV